MKIIESQELISCTLKGCHVAYAPSPAGTAGYVRVIASLAKALGGNAVALLADELKKRNL